MNILVTGASGFIGSNLVRKLATNPAYHMAALVRRKTEISPFGNVATDVIEGDLTDSEGLRHATSSADVIIHLAAVKEHYENKETMLEANVQGTKNLLGCSQQVKQLIFASSTLAANPLDTYSESKKECEEMIKASGINYTILRIAPVFGSGDTTNLTKLIAMIRDGKAIPIPGDGRQLIQPTHIDDVIQAIESSVLNEHYFNRTLVIAGMPITLREFIDVVSRTLDKSPRRIRIPVGVLKPLVKVYQKVSDSPAITVEQLANLGKMRDAEVFDSDFPTSHLEVSIQKTAR